MKQLDNNQKARIADYINGKPVTLTDEELQLLAEDDNLAAECLNIAEISKEYDETASMKKRGNGRVIRMVLMAAAACVVAVLAIAVMQDSNTATHSASSPSLALAELPDNGFSELPKEFAKFVETASASSNGNDLYAAEPDTPFDIELSQAFDGDTLLLCNTKKEIVLRLPVEDKVVPVEGLKAGLYCYYLIYNPKEMGAIIIGKE